MAGEGSDFYLRAAASGVDSDITPGGSSYFSTPEDHLDPRLFSGTTFLPEMRHYLLETLYDFWDAKYKRARSWSTVWVAGSGITYQWAASRGNGDLDVLMGVDFPAFFAANRSYVGLSEEEMASFFNSQLKEELWPAHADDHGFEITYYCNPGAKDIRDINPYAAYNLTDDTWTVTPPVVGANPRSEHPDSFWKAVDSEKEVAARYIARFNAARVDLAGASPGSPAAVNARSALEAAASAAGALFDDIHIARKAAFAPGGSGYGDYFNFRWQAHKDAGTSPALAAIRTALQESRGNAAVDLYGRRLATAEQVRTDAALHAMRARG